MKQKNRLRVPCFRSHLFHYLSSSINIINCWLILKGEVVFIMGCNHDKSCISVVPVFKGMDQIELSLIEKATNSRCYKKGEFIFREGDYSETLYIIHRGLIKLSKISENGKEQIIRILFPGDFFGEFSLMQNEKHYANAETLQETVVCTVEKQGFLKTMEQNPKMAFRFIEALNNRLFHADEWMILLSLSEVDQRLARVLLLFHKKMKETEERITLPISKRDLASLIGTTPETLSRKLVSLASKEIVLLSGRREIQIINRKKLETLAGI